MSAKKIERCCVVIDHWKLPTFETNLKAAGYLYRVTEDARLPRALVLTIETTDKEALGEMVKRTNHEARTSTLNPNNARAK